jgi:hypothetical protein
LISWVLVAGTGCWVLVLGADACAGRMGVIPISTLPSHVSFYGYCIPLREGTLHVR